MERRMGLVSFTMIMEVIMMDTGEMITSKEKVVSSLIRACIIVENENKMVDCKLEFTSSGNDDINGIYSCIGTHNDYIFFRQAQISRFVRRDDQ